MPTIKNIFKIKINLSIIIYISIMAILISGCGKDDDLTITPVLDDDKKITSFVFQLTANPIAKNIVGSINEANKTMTAIMPPGTDVSSLLPTIEISPNSQVNPNTPQDFTNPVAYTVSAEDGSEAVYTATVIVALSQRQILQAILDANPGNLLTWDLQNTPDLGTLAAVTTDAEGSIIKLAIGDENLSQIPSEIGQLINLMVLQIGTNQLTTIPSEIGQLTNLTELDLYDNQLVRIPSEIGQLTNLTKLYIGKNQFTTFPSEIGQLTNLTELGIEQNQLITVPSEIGQLINLTVLDLSHNLLIEIPIEIGQLINLRELDINENQLTTIPSEIGQLINLTVLEIDRNQLTSLPSTISQLTNLQELYCDYNQFTTIPSEIEQLTGLLILTFSNNQLTTIPSGIGQLTELFELDLGDNQLSSLPAEIGFLKDLSSLQIDGNQLTVIPQAICYLEQFNNMDLEMDATTFCETISSKDALIGIHSANPGNLLGWEVDNFLGVEFDENSSVSKIEIQNKGIERILSGAGIFIFCEILDLRNNPLSFIADDVCVLEFTSIVGISILTDPGEGC